MVEVFDINPLGQFFESYQSGSGRGVSVEILNDRGMAQVFAMNGKTAAVERALKIAQTPGKATSSAAYSAIPLTSGQWMLVSGKAKASNTLTKEISAKLKGNGYASEQSDSRVIFRLSGPNVVELMQKGCRLDLHPAATGKNWCAQTQMAQIGVLIHQIDEKPTYDLYIYSGFARDFAEWLAHTGAQLGLYFSK